MPRSLTVESGTLTVGEGVVMRFGPDVSLTIESGGSIAVQGTAMRPVTMGPITPGAAWKGLQISSTSGSNAIVHAIIDEAGSRAWNGNADTQSALWVSGGRVAVTDSIFRRSGRYGVRVERGGAIPGFDRNAFENNQRHAAVSLSRLGDLGGANRFGAANEPFVYVLSSLDSVTMPATWRKIGAPLRFTGEVEIKAPVVVEAGAELVFENQSRVDVVAPSGALTTAGSASDPVVLRGVDAGRGVWTGVRFQTNVSDNRLSHTRIEGAGDRAWTGNAEMVAAVFVDTNASVAMANTTIARSGRYGLWAARDARLPGFAQNTLRDNARAALLWVSTSGAIDTASRFEGNDENVVRIEGSLDDLSAPATWRAIGAPYRVMNEAEIKAALTIEAGAIVEFAQHAALAVTVEGSLAVNGTAAMPVRMRGADAMPGFWKGLSFASRSSANVLTHVELTGAGSRAWTGNVDHTGALYVPGGTISLRQSSITTNGFGVVALNGAAVNLCMTTISAMRGQAYTGTGAVMPMERCM